MDLRRATFLVILGRIYIVLHKGAYGFFPSLSGSHIGGSITSVLWAIAALTLVLFAYQFLREVSPRDRRLRFSLVSIILFTGMVVISRLMLWPFSGDVLLHRVAFGLSRLLNSFAVLMFLLSLARLVARGSPLRAPLRGSIWACGLSAALGIVSSSYFWVFLLTGRESEPLPFLQPLAISLFLFAYGMIIWLLVTFRRIDDYRDFASG